MNGEKAMENKKTILVVDDTPENIDVLFWVLNKMPEKIRLEVADRGIGISPDELPNIFNRFYRVKSSADYDARGSGLGLTLAKHVIDAHGWQIDVKSNPGQGSIFSISIPLNAKEEKSI